MSTGKPAKRPTMTTPIRRSVTSIPVAWEMPAQMPARTRLSDERRMSRRW